MQHVPAWKRLGLKLKYAKDSPDPSGQAPVEAGYSPQGSKRQSTANSDETTSKPSKKQKLSRENGQTFSEANWKDDKSHSPSQPNVKTVSVDPKASKGKHQTFESEEYVKQPSFQCFPNCVQLHMKLGRAPRGYLLAQKSSLDIHHSNVKNNIPYFVATIADTWKQ